MGVHIHLIPCGIRVEGRGMSHLLSLCCGKRALCAPVPHRIRTLEVHIHCCHARRRTYMRGIPTRSRDLVGSNGGYHARGG